MTPTTRAWVTTGFTWLGRLAALGLFLLWGAFFVEHLVEWFLDPTPAVDLPFWVWLAQFFHLLMLVGLALMLWWDRLGAVVTVVGTAAFLGVIAAQRSVVFLLLVNLIPVACFAVVWALRALHPVPPRAAGG